MSLASVTISAKEMHNRPIVETQALPSESERTGSTESAPFLPNEKKMARHENRMEHINTLELHKLLGFIAWFDLENEVGATTCSGVFTTLKGALAANHQTNLPWKNKLESSWVISGHHQSTHSPSFSLSHCKLVASQNNFQPCQVLHTRNNLLSLIPTHQFNIILLRYFVVDVEYAERVSLVHHQ